MKVEPMFPEGHPAANGPLLTTEQKILNTLLEIRDLLTPKIIVEATEPAVVRPQNKGVRKKGL